MEPIAVRRYGEAGPRVVVLHGGPGAPGSVASLARALASRVRVLEPLQRRAGRVSLTVERHVLDLAQVAPEQALLVGWSWGAMLGLSYAARFPERVRGLVLVGCGTYHADDRALFEARLDARLGEPGRARRTELQAALRTAQDAAERSRRLAALGTLMMSAESYDRLTAGEGHDELTVDAAGHRETWNDVLRLQAEGIEPQAFTAIRAPALMLHGDADPHPGQATRDRLRPFLPQLEYVEYPRCGHEPWRERHARDAFLEQVCDWVRALG